MRRAVAVLALALVATTVALWALDKAFPPQLTAAAEDFAQVVIDANGSVLRAFPDRSGVWRYATTLDRVDPKYVEALLTFEDRWFWHHPGVNPAALVRASVQNISSGSVVSGGSTITMQVARLLHGYDRSLAGKLRQMLRALQLEWHLSKPAILTLYLNYAPFGGTLEGIQAASIAYFGQDAAHLTHAQAALLAALPQAPSRLRPDRHRGRAERARNKVLNRVLRFGVWDADTVSQAQAEPIAARSPQMPIRAPLLTRRLVREQPREPVIASTINGHLQTELEAYAVQAQGRLHERASLAIVVVDNHSREVLGYVGSAEFLSETRQGHVDMIQAYRSPGSTLKPLLFALAIDEGMIHSQSLLIDAPRLGGYRPQNFGKRFRGPVTASTALRESLNVPSVDLLETYGSARFAAQLEHAGLPLKVPGGRANLSLILGGAGLRLDHLVMAYAALATDGVARPLRFVADRNLAAGPRERRFISEGAAWIVSRMLQAGAPREAGQGWAWKTGTSYGFRDAWAVGYNARYTVGVWTGRPDGTPVPGHYGRNTAAPMLFDVARRLPSAGGRSRPASVSSQDICWPLGTQSTAQPDRWCHRRFRAWILDGMVPPSLPDPNDPEPLLVRYWQDTRSKLRVGTMCQDGQAEAKTKALWPRRTEAWLPGPWKRASLLPPLAEQCQEAALPTRTLRVEGIEDGQVIRARGSARVNLSASGGMGAYHWYVDGTLHHHSSEALDITHRFQKPGHRQIVVMDDMGNSASADVQVIW